jgi:hypothetical protein
MNTDECPYAMEKSLVFETRLKMHSKEAEQQSYDRLLQTDGLLTPKALAAAASLTEGCFNRACSEERYDLDGM